MNNYLDHYLNYLAVERGLARNTLDAYGRDLARYLEYLERQKVSGLEKITPTVVLRFLGSLKEAGLSARSRASLGNVASSGTQCRPSTAMCSASDRCPLASTLCPRARSALPLPGRRPCRPP